MERDGNFLNNEERGERICFGMWYREKERSARKAKEMQGKSRRVKQGERREKEYYGSVRVKEVYWKGAKCGIWWKKVERERQMGRVGAVKALRLFRDCCSGTREKAKEEMKSNR